MSKYIKLEDAIHNLNMVVVGRTEYTEKMKADLFFAIDNLPTIEVSEDAISREWVLEKMLAEAEHYNDEVKHGYHNCELIVYDAPSVVPNRPKGKWIDDLDDRGFFNKCSLCGYNNVESYYHKPHPNFCPKCGADMRGNKE